jgi:hypothetical protein
MPSRGRRGGGSIRRRAPSRQPKQRILIVCEGRVTEPTYFRDLRQEARNPRVELVIARETGVPLTVVEIAVRLRSDAASDARRQRDDNLLYDQVWAVFDVDEHSHLDRAKALARENGIELAVSNPCFELWALLHFQEQRAYIERQPLRMLLQRHLPGYDKVLAFVRLHPAYSDAVRRAEDLNRDSERQNESGRNPTTGVYRLTTVILTG